MFAVSMKLTPRSHALSKMDSAVVRSTISEPSALLGVPNIHDPRHSAETSAPVLPSRT
jgi:hypothetical protein